MKIIQIEAIPILVPLKAINSCAAHGSTHRFPYVIVRVCTDEGLIGLGEGDAGPSLERERPVRAALRP